MRWSSVSGKVDDEARAFPRGAPGLNRAAVCVDDFPGDVQAQAQPAEMHQRRDPLEALEQLALVFFRDANPRILHLQTRAALLRRDRYVDRLAGAELDGIRHQVDDHAFNLFAIPLSDDVRVRMNVERTMGLA